MSSILAESARYLGLDPAEEVPEPPTFRPAQLSSTTRRMSKADEFAQANTDAFSPLAMARQEALLAQDAMEDAAWKREMEQMAMSAEWKQKIAVQKQGIAALAALKDLRGDEPDYEDRYFEILSRNPLAVEDESFKHVASFQAQTFKNISETRKLIAEREQAKADRAAAEAAELNQKVGLDVAKLPAAGQAAYQEALAAGSTPVEAFQRASIASQVAGNEVALAAAGAPQTAEDFDPATQGLQVRPDGMVGPGLPGRIAEDDVATAAAIKEVKDNELSARDMSAIRTNLTSLERERRPLQAERAKIQADTLLTPEDKAAQLAQIDAQLEPIQQEITQYRSILDTRTKEATKKNPGFRVEQLPIDSLFTN